MTKDEKLARQWCDDNGYFPDGNCQHAFLPGRESLRMEAEDLFDEALWDIHDLYCVLKSRANHDEECAGVHVIVQALEKYRRATGDEVSE